MAEKRTNTGAKVDNKALEVKIDALSDYMKTAVDDMKEIHKTVINNQVTISGLISKQDSMCKDIETLEGKSNTWSILNSAGVAIAAILGITK